MKREIWKGSEAIAEAAIRAGCRGFFGYPITPQNEIPEYMSHKMAEAGGVFVQAESEVSAINMVYGAAGAGVRCMTSSSSPGVSLKQEGISYMAGAKLPAVIVNVMRGGPGLGSIQPSQADYYQATRGGGNGDYRTPVLAPANLQEAVDLVQEAFDIADQYRTPVMILADGLIGQMMEPIVWHDIPKRDLPPKTWAANGRGDRDHNNFINSLLIDAPACERHNQELLETYHYIEEHEVRWEELMTEDAEIVITAYGTPARIAITAAENLRKKGIKAGVFRPITLWPFPFKRLKEIASQDSVKVLLDVEMSTGQMLDDVNLAVAERKPVKFYGRYGGVIPTVSEIEAAAEAACGEVK
ncbi:2-ketoisovalerate ferredoxin oxidoreductase [Megasphaera cerevisiae DSM 20462]|jgi:2-oxoglutarate ferredoxin oxidoreductase subunit alpha|uniref:2-ketoisovalerate ferredoxin oxidoreductase n=1 Tax=Megasphaera cerevisiae DSM 20462 TaxID=1122219 RepID=A0A0J6WUS2_9FIRM|nr:3-methyl-2-oxobutanoate dehydrogenase subunit VorB [Megasphaera cerevisiae]KMO87295.1 2-ketoisovalerate ferredoxin oxidoreductase [Megasphaera cerevisiae DSM 20462]OKY54550.1 3-methyl-2-oxobutanoate dehydrogenase subunit VorB [Megasphaera cerevisiae]SJZ48606.1 2-oxoglutarate ferredoxin oxidoreductase subunit alpha [Megasphaera cerevisiae DSM 20462]